MAVLGPESGFSFIALTNSHPMIGIGEIQLGKSLCPAEPIQQLANQRQRTSVFDSYIVKTPIIYAKAEASIRLLIEEDKCSGGELERPDEVISQVGFDVYFQRF